MSKVDFNCRRFLRQGTVSESFINFFLTWIDDNEGLFTRKKKQEDEVIPFFYVRGVFYLIGHSLSYTIYFSPKIAVCICLYPDVIEIYPSV